MKTGTFGLSSIFALLAFPFSSAAEPATITMFENSVDDAENWRVVNPEDLILFDVVDASGAERGRILIEAAPFAAPAHVERIRTLARSGKYDGTPFHRVISDFMAQGGDIEQIDEVGSGLPDLAGEFAFRRDPAEMPLDSTLDTKFATAGYYQGFPIVSESPLLMDITGETTVSSWIPHCAGVTSMARTSDPDSANSQFFLMRETSQHLDNDAGRYSAWGRVIEGLDVVRSIKRGSDGDNGSVQNPDILRRAVVVSDLEEAERPSVVVERTDGPMFTAKMAVVGNTKVAVCDLPKPRTLVMREDLDRGDVSGADGSDGS